MRNLKRLLTMVMAIAMMMSLMTVGAGAAFKDQDKIENTEAVNMNVALGIINGRDDGSFDPAGNVTRAEMAKMICVLLNGGTEPRLGTKPAPVFTDIKGHWAEKYVEYCASLGIIAGMGDGTFAPDKTVTATQAAKMLLVALGYDAANEEFNGPSWSVKIGVAANMKDLYDELGAIDPNAALNRDDAAQMIWNALQAKEVEYTYSLTTVNGQLQNVQVRKDKDDTLMTDKFKTIDTDLTNAVMTGISYNSTSEKYTYTFANENSKYTTFTTKLDFTNLFGHNVTTVAKTTSDVYGMYANDSTVIFSGVMDDVDFAKAMDTNKPTVEFNDKDYDLAKTVKKDGKVVSGPKTVAFNGTTAADVTTDAPGKAYFKVSAIDNTDDGKIDLFVYYPVSWGQVTYVGKDYIRVDGEVGKQLYFDDYEIYKGVAKDDYVMLNENGLVDDVVTKLDEVSGKLTNIANNTVTIDGKKYSQVALAKDKRLESGNINDTFKFVAIDGFLVKQSASDVVNLDEILMVASTAEGKNANGGTDAKVYFTDGTSKVVSVKSDSPAVAAKDTVYKYEVSKGEYKLTKLTSDVTFGFDYAKNNPDSIKWTAKNTGLDYATVDNYRIADNAIVLAQDNKTTTFNLITGSKLSKVTDQKLTVYAYGVEKNDTTGFNYVTFAVVSGTTSATSDRNYGFIMSNVDVSKNADKENVYTFDMWNGKEKVAMTTTGNATGAKNLAKGDVISYSLNGDKIDDATILDSAYGTATYGAVLATDGKYVDILTDAAGTVERFKIDAEDTTKMYISKEDKTGDATGNIVMADKSDTATEFKSGKDYYVANVLFINNDLLVIDVDNDIKGVSTVTTTATTSAEIQALLDTNAKVTVTKAATLTEDLTVPAGKTLILEDNLTVKAGKTLDVNGTLTVAGAVAIEADATIDFAAKPAAALMAKLEAVTTVDATIIFGVDATSAAANIWYTTQGASDTDAKAVGAEAAITKGTYVFAENYGWNTGAQTVDGWFLQAP